MITKCVYISVSLKYIYKKCWQEVVSVSACPGKIHKNSRNFDTVKWHGWCESFDIYGWFLLSLNENYDHYLIFRKDYDYRNWFFKVQSCPLFIAIKWWGDSVCGWVGLRLWTTPGPAQPAASLRAAKLSNFPSQRNFNLGGSRDQRAGSGASIDISKNWGSEGRPSCLLSSPGLAILATLGHLFT